MNICSRRCRFSNLTATINLPACKALLTQLTKACCLQSSVFMKVELLLHFCDNATGFPTDWSHYELKAFDVILGNKLFVIRQNCIGLLLVLVIFPLQQKTSNCFLLKWKDDQYEQQLSQIVPYLYRKLNGRRECKVLYEEKGTVQQDSILPEE